MANNIPLSNLTAPNARLNGADRLELSRIELAGITMNAFNNATKFKDKHRIIRIKHGRGVRIDAIGEAGAMYHTPGMDLSDSGNQIQHDAFDLMVDAKLISHVYLDDIEEAMSHLDLKTEYGTKLGTALAQAFDRNLAQLASLAARHATRVPGGIGGSVLRHADYGDDALTLAQGLFDAEVIFDEKNIPEGKRWCFLQPRYHSLLKRNLELINKINGGSGSITDNNTLNIAGFTLVKSNNVPDTNVTNSYKNKYDGDFTDTIAVCMTEEAIASVQLKDLAVETTWDHNRQATFTAAKFTMGHGVMRPECAVELNKKV